MLKRIAVSLGFVAMLVASCSSSDSDSTDFLCENTKSKCPNDGPLPVEECRQIISHPKCSSVFIEFLRCLGDHQTCLPDGTTDQSATERACAAQQNAAMQCADVPDAGGAG